ncbi:MAG: hypothetical protein ACPGED_07940 [Flavobacteriales bacterium]
MKPKPYQDIQEGELVKLVGEVEISGDPLQAPFSGKECAFYSAKAERDMRLPSDSYNLKTRIGPFRGGSGTDIELIEVRKSTKFHLKVDGQYVVLESSCLRSSSVRYDRTTTSGFKKKPSANERAFLDQHGIRSDQVIGGRKELRYIEGKYLEGDRLSVYGRAHWEWADDHGLEKSQLKVLVIKAADDGVLYVSDFPK